MDITPYVVFSEKTNACTGVITVKATFSLQSHVEVPQEIFDQYVRDAINRMLVDNLYDELTKAVV